MASNLKISSKAFLYHWIFVAGWKNGEVCDLCERARGGERDRAEHWWIHSRTSSWYSQSTNLSIQMSSSSSSQSCYLLRWPLSSADGFLVLGHDVDRYSPDDTIPIWDKYGFEKMQSFSGAMSQLNFWRQWIPDTQIKDMAFCKGDDFLKI